MKVLKIKITWLSTSVMTSPYGESWFADQRELYESWRYPESVDVAELEWRHPWRDISHTFVEPDRSVWRQMLGGIRLTDERTNGFVRGLFKRAIPLRAGVALGSEVESSAELRAEVFLHPWAATAAVTATIDFEPGKTVRETAEIATDLAEQPLAECEDLAVKLATGPALARGMARTLAEELGHGPDLLDIGPFVIATPIDADVDSPHVLPLNEPGFAVAMHELAGQRSSPNPFRWIKVSNWGEPLCLETDLRRVLRTGMSQWVQPALLEWRREPIDRTIGAHRNAVLRWARLAALQGELEVDWAAPTPDYFRTQLRDHRMLLGRLLSALGDRPDWIAQRYIAEQGLSSLLDAPDEQNPGICPPDDD